MITVFEYKNCNKTIRVYDGKHRCNLILSNQLKMILDIVVPHIKK